MKELSIKEKAKRYDEAIERAKNFIENGDESERTIAESIFAGLMEVSEDERIRKKLVQFFKEKDEEDFEEWVPKAKVLAWLEKQGEQKTVDEIAKEVCKNKESATAFLKSAGIMNEKGELAEQYRQGEQKSIDDLTQQEAMDIAVAKCFVQGEQQPTDKVEPKFKVGDIIKNKKNGDTVKVEQILSDSYCYSGWDGAATIHSDFLISDQDNWELVEQNPSWSEEDERMRCLIISHFESHKLNHEYITTDDKVIKWLNSLKKSRTKQGCCECDEIDIQAAIEICENAGYNLIANRLKSLKDRVQPKQEWSQTDNEFADDAIACVTRCYEKYIDNKDFYQSLRHNTLDIKRWLIDVRKRLKPQSTWKPSDRQMKAIEHICDGNYNVDLDILDSIYRDFKKLREE